RQKQEEKRLNEQLAKAEDALNRKQFEQQKQNKLAEIAISTAVGIAGALPNLLLAGIVGTAGALQAAMVASQKYTALYDGGILKGTTSGTVIAGERGYDEIVLPLRPERLRELGITGGGNVFNFYMTLGAGTTREQAREVWEFIKEFAREGEAA
ncbi:MAG: hypothetical protein JW697_08610, partial [Kosmotogaceae bacterium]|nr:hypothetical protein [Kosmotogaceae bacterium]